MYCTIVGIALDGLAGRARRSLIWRRNKIAASTYPCGAPALVAWKDEEQTSTDKLLFGKKLSYYIFYNFLKSRMSYPVKLFGNVTDWHREIIHETRRTCSNTGWQKLRDLQRGRCFRNACCLHWIISRVSKNFRGLEFRTVQIISVGSEGSFLRSCLGICWRWAFELLDKMLSS